jgi:hypothetical protein
MQNKTYTPKPIDTSDIQLSDELLQLTELMARNVHDIWSMGRIADGWTWGPQRDDARKENPCLVPYEELPESEKAYDRNTAIETLRLILSLGYEIKKSAN